MFLNWLRNLLAQLSVNFSSTKNRILRGKIAPSTYNLAFSRYGRAVSHSPPEGVGCGRPEQKAKNMPQHTQSAWGGKLTRMMLMAYCMKELSISDSSPTDITCSNKTNKQTRAKTQIPATRYASFTRYPECRGEPAVQNKKRIRGSIP